MLATQSPVSRRSTSNLLGTLTPPLMLRVCGGSRRGQVVQIRAAKCTVGSAPGCTLRLRADGVAPLHCWILRGTHGAIIRRAAGHALLNNRVYRDAPLATGDRLVIGSVELEVIECGSAAWPQAELPEPTSSPPSHAPTHELEACLTAANEEIARLEADAKQAWQTSHVASERAEQMYEALERTNVELGEVRAELEAAQAALQDATQDDARHELQAARDALRQAESIAAERAQHIERLEADCLSRDRRVSQLQGELETARRAAMAAARQSQASPATMAMGDLQAELRASAELEQRRAALEAEVTRLQGELQAAAAFRQEAAHWQAQLREVQPQLDHWQAEAHQRHQQLEAAEAQLGVLRAELQQASDRREELDRQAAELAVQQAAGEAARVALETRQQELTAAEQALASERGVWREEQQARSKQIAEREATIGEQTTQLAEKSRELQEQSNRLAEQQAEIAELKSRLEGETADEVTRQRQLDDHSAELAERSEKLDEREALLSRRHQELATEHAAWQAERQAWEDQHTERPAEEDFDLPATGQLADNVQDNAPAPDLQPNVAANSGANPHDSGSVDSVLSRLVQAGLWRQDGSDPAGAEEADGPSAEQPSAYQPPKSYLPGPEEIEKEQPQPSAPLAMSPTGPIALNAQPQAVPTGESGRAAEHHDEESIESYMQKLMQRVRGDSDKPGSAGASPGKSANLPSDQPTSQPEAASALAAFASQPATPQKNVTPEEYVPRSPPPEMNANLAAMRELANSAARSAIAKHQRTHTNKKATGKILGAGALLVCSLLLGGWAWYTWTLAPAIGAGVGLLISGIWCLLAIMRMLRAMRLHQPVAAPSSQPQLAQPSEPAAAVELIANVVAAEGDEPA